MNPLSILRRRTAWRWLAPAGLVGGVAVAATAMLGSAPRSEPLPVRSAADLLAAVRLGTASGYSGTVVADLALGLPPVGVPAPSAQLQSGQLPSGQLPSAVRSPEAAAVQPALDVLNGPHTMRVWCDGADAERLSVLSGDDETDVFRIGSSLWEWDSDERVATHTLVAGTTGLAPMSLDQLSPEQLATRALSSMDAQTHVTAAGDLSVAGRRAYQLVLTPSSGTRVRAVHIAIDSVTNVPLQVQVYARGADGPVVDVAFTSVSMKRPAPAMFRFTPPPGARVIDARSSVSTPKATQPKAAAAAPHVIGSGWGSIAEYPTVRDAAGEAAELVTALSPHMTPVYGSWGRGRVLELDLMSVLLTSDGRLLAGAVDPAALFAAAAH